MTSISEGFADLLGDRWAIEHARLGAIAQRFVSDADDADAVVDHAVDMVDASRFAHAEDGEQKAIDALHASVRAAAGEAIDAGATPSVPANPRRGRVRDVRAALVRRVPAVSAA